MLALAEVVEPHAEDFRQQPQPGHPPHVPCAFPPAGRASAASGSTRLISSRVNPDALATDRRISSSDRGNASRGSPSTSSARTRPPRPNARNRSTSLFTHSDPGVRGEQTTTRNFDSTSAFSMLPDRSALADNSSSSRKHRPTRAGRPFSRRSFAGTRYVSSSRWSQIAHLRSTAWCR